MCNSPTISTASSWCKYIFKTHKLFSFQKQTDKKTKWCLPSRKCFISMALVSFLTYWVQLSSFQGRKVQKKSSCQTIIHVPHPPLTLYYAYLVLMLTHGHVLPHIHSHTLQPFAPHLPVRQTFNDAKERTSETGKQKEWAWNVASANEVEVIHGRKCRGEEGWMEILNAVCF